jgi:iron complex transport system ATP-binding protein
MSKPIVFEGIGFGYGRQIFDKLDLCFDAGRWHALIGPNAVGKSTLLKLATGLLKPTRGAVRLGDRQITEMEPRTRAQQLAVVPQFETNIFPMSVRELVSTGRFCRQEGYFAGSSDAAVDHALQRAGIAHLAERSVWSLSGGERQRALIARALAQDAEWLLLDEATTFLDLRAEYELLALLGELHQAGLSIISVTHDLQAAARADAVTLLMPGEVVQGTPTDVLTPALLERAYGIPFYVEMRDGAYLIGPRLA